MASLRLGRIDANKWEHEDTEDISTYGKAGHDWKHGDFGDGPELVAAADTVDSADLNRVVRGSTGPDLLHRALQPVEKAHSNMNEDSNTTDPGVSV